MFFRFGAAIAMIVAVSLVGTTLEKRNLELKRAVSRQHYRLQVLDEQYASQRLIAQQLGAPARLIGEVESELAPQAPPAKPARPAKSKSTRKSAAPRHK